MIVKDIRHLSIVDGQGFCEMVSAFNPYPSIKNTLYKFNEKINVCKKKTGMHTPDAKIAQFRNNLDVKLNTL